MGDHQDLRRPRSHTDASSEQSELHESGVVPSRPRDELVPAATLRAPREQVVAYGSSLASGGDFLLVGGRLVERHPFAALYRITPEGAVRERLLRGAPDHLGPALATDGTRVAVGQPSADGGTGFVNVYRRRSLELEVEAALEGEPGTRAGTRFGERLALGHDLLVLGQAASVRVYRHSAVGWLAAGPLETDLPYAWNPRLGDSLAVARGRVLVGNPVEISGHRVGPGRVLVYRQQGEKMLLDERLRGDGTETGRSEPPVSGFGARIEVAGDLVLVSAPHERLPDGERVSRIYVFRADVGGLRRVGSLAVPSCDGGMCLVGDRLFVLGDALHVFTRRGSAFTAHASYQLYDASEARLASCGHLLAIGRPALGAGEVTLHFADQL